MNGRGFLDLKQLIVPVDLAMAANEHLRRVGRQGYEGFALWAGHRDGTTFHVTETIIPRQSGIRYASGVCVRVEGDELHRLNMYLYGSGLSLISQLHSHPGAAYHSDTDDEFPIATTAGAFSLVVPDFAVQSFALEGCAVYRLIPGRGWVHMPPDQASALIHILHN